MTALAIAGSLTFLGAGVAQAGDFTYPGEDINVSVNDSVVNIGQVFIFNGSNFAPGETVNITITLLNEPTAAGSAGGTGIGGGFGAGVTGVIVPATVTDNLSTEADADGNWAVEIALDTPGEYLLTAVGEESGVESSATVTVDGAADGSVAGGTDDSAAGGTGAGSDAASDDAVANGDRLADTGLDSSALLWGGAGVLALGAGATAVVVSRRKNA
ncbi:LPXTG cell wall anchor domain-containing protein [Arthrobacter sp. VKM Ac-2550]|uniref:LPXTG cell wall anchor domain-containing protein n=1 Tax=Crystallibacter permensis TaxID=1938888 RepID=UPI0022270887|nr:LPXTG cell wall anchor domain-containing protein [Arthrobacter sp. VKM Ac-2550]